MDLLVSKQECWTEREVRACFGDEAVERLQKAGIKPASQLVYTCDQVALLEGSDSLALHRPIWADVETFALVVQGHAPVALGNTLLFKLAAYLARRPDNFRHFDDLKLYVWQDELVEDETISRTVRRLRQRIVASGISSVRIATQKFHVALQTG